MKYFEIAPFCTSLLLFGYCCFLYNFLQEAANTAFIDLPFTYTWHWKYGLPARRLSASDTALLPGVEDVERNPQCDEQQAHQAQNYGEHNASGASPTTAIIGWRSGRSRRR
jgi:hypothetical protein